MNLPFRAIVWDLDGTLVDSAADIAYSLNILLAEDGLEPHPLPKVQKMVGNGVAKLVERGYKAAGAPLSHADMPSRVARFMEIYGQNATRETALFPGAEDLLRGYHAAGVAQGLCTNKPEGISRHILKVLGIDGLFSSVIGGDTCPVNKPDPLPLLTCVTELGGGLDGTVMVGDSGVDARTARAAAIPCVLVSFGYLHEPIESLGADAIADDYAALPAALAGLMAPAR